MKRWHGRPLRPSSVTRKAPKCNDVLYSRYTSAPQNPIYNDVITGDVSSGRPHNSLSFRASCLPSSRRVSSNRRTLSSPACVTRLMQKYTFVIFFCLVPVPLIAPTMAPVPPNSNPPKKLPKLPQPNNHRTLLLKFITSGNPHLGLCRLRFIHRKDTSIAVHLT